MAGTKPLTSTIDEDLLERSKDTVFAVQKKDPSFSMRRLVELGLGLAIEKLKGEHNRARDFPRRPDNASLRTGPRAS